MTNALRLGVSALATIGAVGFGLLAGCSSSSTDDPSDTGADTNITPDATPDAAPEVVAEVASETEAAVGDTMAHLRVAHLVAGGPAIDVCVLPKPATGDPDFTAATAIPALHAKGLDTGLVNQKVTGYVDLPPTAYVVRVVAAGSVNCKTELITGATFPLGAAFTAGQYLTAAAIGKLGATDATAVKIVTMIDDTPADLASPVPKVTVRVFHAAPGLPTVDIGTAPGGSALVLVAWNGLAYGTGAPATFALAKGDANSYAKVPLSGPIVLGAAATGTKTPLLTKGKATYADGAILSAFLIMSADTTTPVVLSCDDTITPLVSAGAVFSNCTVLPAS